jgi:hypothetical protein
MKMEDVLALAKAGFTAAQIAALSQATNTQPTTPPVTQPTTPPVTQPTTPPVTQPTNDPVLAEIQKLAGFMQASNILNSNQQPPVQSTEDILASIINPPAATEKK